VTSAVSTTTDGYWAIIPAAGSGKRMASSIPKQYLTVHGRSVLEWALLPFLSDQRCRAVIVIIAVDDEHWPRLFLQHAKLHVVAGGAERADSVLAGLNALLQSRHSPAQGEATAEAKADDWVLIHDAARPCLHPADLDALLMVATNHEPVGALLATPVADTLKQAATDQRVTKTVPRAGLWRALTPQMFRAGALRTALQNAASRGITVTDESSAMEALGQCARLINGRSDNIKITVPDDLPLAENILAARHLDTHSVREPT
jgi:2-C-methyl-D-erythritol 4-phosphate cytidylyltransferase